MLHASNEFIYRVLGRKYLRDELPDLARAVQDSDAYTPIVLLFSNGNLSIYKVVGYYNIKK